MPRPISAWLVDLLPGLALGTVDGTAGNRLAVEGLAIAEAPGGLRTIRAAKVEASGLRLALGDAVLEIGRATLREIAAQVALDAGGLRLHALEAAGAELAGCRVTGPLRMPRHAPAGPWELGPLATANGTLRAEIVDAHLLFDADVTVPIREGRVDFNAATVEHVGPDSRMGVSRLGLYVDAPNGRSYLYQFASAPVAGVEFERRGALPGPWAGERGHLQLQPFVEGLLRHACRPAGHGELTGQARLLFERTAVAGEMRLGDGPIAMPGLRAALAGRAEGRNVIRVHSQAVGRGFTAELPDLAAGTVVADPGEGGIPLRCDAVAGALAFSVVVDATQLRFVLDVPTLRLDALRGAHGAETMR